MSKLSNIYTLNTLLTTALQDLKEKRDMIATTGRPCAAPTFGGDLPMMTETFGGLQPGIWTLGGAPGTGKTFFALVLGHAYLADDDTCVLIVDVAETRPTNYLALRLACIHSHQDPYRYERAKATPEEFAAIAALLKFKADTLFDVLVPGPALTVGHISAAVKDLQARTGMAHCMVVIDYIQKLAMTTAVGGNASDLRLKVSAAVAELTGLVDIAQGPVILISSVGKEAYRNGSAGANLADFKETGDVEFSTDVGLMLRLAKDTRNDDMHSNVRALECSVLKNRFGETGKFPMYLIRDESRYVEQDPGSGTGTGRDAEIIRLAR
jgi:replicative DNA helicase